MADALDESPPLRFDIRRKAHAMVVSVTGEIDIDTVNDLTDALAEPLSETEHLIVDLTDVGFIDSIGLRGLVDIHIQARSAGRQVRLVLGQGATRRPIEISGLDQVLAIYDTVETALE